MSISTNNFIKAIYKLEKIPGADTRPGSIAKTLAVTNAAATDMARKLAAKKLIHYTRYRKLTLTSEGKKIALNIIRKHRLWESFLHKTLNLSLHEIHREAELLEHLTSDFLADKINTFLGNPEYDPHGDPIPNDKGDILFSKENVILTNALPGNYYIISRLFSSEKDFFDFCSSNNITIGSTIKVEKQYGKTNMTEIRINNTKLLLNKDFTNIIYVHKQSKNEIK